jgi:hypothetical protein
MAATLMSRLFKQAMAVADEAQKYMSAVKHLDRLASGSSTVDLASRMQKASDSKARHEGRLAGALFRLDEIMDK